MSTVKSLDDVVAEVTKQENTISIMPPDWLDESALIRWNEIVPRLIQAGIINELDEDVIAIYCSLYSQFLSAKKSLTEVGQMQTTQSGYQQLTAAFVAYRQLSTDMLKYMSRLGLTPQARMALRFDKPKDDDDFDKL